MKEQQKQGTPEGDALVQFQSASVAISAMLQTRPYSSQAKNTDVILADACSAMPEGLRYMKRK